MKRALLISSLLSFAALAQAGMPGTQPGTTNPPQPNPNTLQPNPPGTPPNTVVPAPVVNPIPAPTVRMDGGVK